MNFTLPYIGMGPERGQANRNLLLAVLTITMMVLAPTSSVAQSGDAAFRVNQLEEQVRQLNGKIEEMNFQLLQIQEQMRRMQEDNEFRFQELEEKRQGSLKGGSATQTAKDESDNRLGKPQPSELSDGIKQSDGNSKIAKLPRTIDGVEIFDGTSAAGSRQKSGIEVPLGTITFDAEGNIVDSALGKPLDLTSRLKQSPDQNISLNVDDKYASIQTPRELFELGFDYFQSGDYFNSEKVFTAFGERFPDDKKMPNAQFWLGESKFSRSDFKGAAKVFLDAHTNWPDARIAPQTLLKLGLSLAGMNQRELACATYAKVYKKYPQISETMRARVAAEQKSAHCLNG